MLKLTRWVMAHRWIVVITWIVVTGALFAASLTVGTRKSNNFSLPNTDSQRAIDLLQSRYPAQAGDTDQIVFHTRTGKLTDASERAVIVPLLAHIAHLPHVAGVVSPYQPGAGAISKTGTIGFATVEFDQAANQLSTASIQNVIHAAESARSPALQVELGGDAITQVLGPSPGFVTLIGLAAAIVVLLISFGSLLAMGLPVVSALFGLGASIGLIALLSHPIDMVDFSSELALMVGLGVGIDYALFVVTRFRSAYRENGGQVEAAVELAMNTAGRAIVFAGSTVVLALLGLCALGVSMLYGAAIAASLAVALVLAASLTLLPVLLRFTGHRIGRLRGRRAQQREPQAGFWFRWVSLIQRRPVVAAVAATALLLVLASPALGLRLGQSDAGNDPTSFTTRRAYDLLATGFGAGFNGPLVVAVQLPGAGKTAGLAGLESTLGHTAGVASVATPQLNPARDTAVIMVYPTTSPQSVQTTDLIKRLRSTVLPPLARATGTAIHVDGATAAQVDFAHVLTGKLPLFIIVVVGLSAVLLLLIFRSLLIPLQAALMNLLSFAAALGIVVGIFQHGWLGSVIGVQAGPITPIIPVMVFAVVFGLSMDYEVFLVSRIHEEWRRSGDPSEAVRQGVGNTGRVIIAAAAVMIAVFASVALGSGRELKLVGIALAAAIFLDAVVIRSVLLPAVLELLGRRTWAFPGWLDRRLPRLAIEPPTQPVGVLEEGSVARQTPGIDPSYGRLEDPKWSEN